VFDHALLFHAFVDYIRDYEVVFFASAAPSTGIPPEHLRYVFRYCVEAIVESLVELEIWRMSLDDALINYETGVDLDGFVWGVKWQVMYPGASLVEGSTRAEKYQHALGIQFYEATIETNAQRITLVFSDLIVEAIEPGYSTFTVTEP